MRRGLTVSFLTLALLFLGLVGIASADPVSAEQRLTAKRSLIPPVFSPIPKLVFCTGVPKMPERTRALLRFVKLRKLA